LRQEPGPKNGGVAQEVGDFRRSGLRAKCVPVHAEANMTQKRASKSAPSSTSPGCAEILIRANPSGGLMTTDSQVQKATQALPALGEALAGPMNEFWQNLIRHAPAPPDEVEVKLALNFEGGTSWAIVAKVGATVDVTMKWTSQPK
jgi:hypothetical protein